MKKEITKDVLGFHKECAEIVGSFEQERFEISMYQQAPLMESPIEQILYSAFYTVAKINFLEPPKVFLHPQRNIGKYRVDFWATEEFSGDQRQLVIECDSQQFHDRSEKERRYEKTRDRFIQTAGFKVFRFTGTEIKNDPFRVAAEILAYLLDRPFDEVYDVNFLP